MTTRDFLTNEIIFLKLSWMADFTLMTVEESGLLVQERGFQAVLATSDTDSRSSEEYGNEESRTWEPGQC